MTTITRSHPLRAAGVLLLCLTAASHAQAQTTAEARETLERRTRPGDRITVDARDGSRTEGRLVRAAADALVVKKEGGELSIDYDDIDRVRRRRNGILLGAVVGLGAGVAYGIPVRMLLNNEGGPGTRALVSLAAIGTAVGILADSQLSLNRTVYQRSFTAVTFGVSPRYGGAAVGVTARW